MESFNFGAFDPTIGARIAAIPQEAQKQQSANMLQAMQMQGAMRQNEMSQMQLEQMKTDRAEMVKLQQDLAANGNNPDLKSLARMLLNNPKTMSQGLELTQKIRDDDLYEQYQQRRFRGATPSANALMPAAAPEPGSFGADVAARAAAVPAWAQGNALAPPETAPANAMVAEPTLADLRAEAQELSRLKSPLAIKELAFVREQIKQLTQPRVVAPGGTVLGAGNVPMYTAPAAPTELSRYEAERAAMLPGDPRVPKWDAKIAELSTAPAAQRDITNRQGAERIKQGWGQLNVAQQNLAVNQARLELQKNAPKLGLIDPEDIDRVAFAVANGKIPVDRLNSTTAPLFAKLLKAQPDLDLTNLGIEQSGAKTSFVTSARIAARQTLTDVDATQAENIAKGNLPPATGPNAGKIMNAVIAINPEYNSRDFGLQTAAEKEFNIGKNGNKTRSLNVAVSHLGTLDTAAAALRAGDVRAFNQFKQAWQRETGKPAPTNFNAVRELVADEIVAAVVPGVGALADRKALKDTLMAKSSPEQLQGVVKEYKELLGGQLGGLEKQYNASTRKTDFKQRYLTPEAIAALTTAPSAPPAGAASTATNTNPYAAKTDAEILRALEGK